MQQVLLPEHVAALEKALKREVIDGFTLSGLRARGQTTRLVGRWVDVEGLGLGLVESFHPKTAVLRALYDSTHTVAFESGAEYMTIYVMTILHSCIYSLMYIHIVYIFMSVIYIHSLLYICMSLASLVSLGI